MRPLWRTYAKGAEGIMFVIDSADHDTLEESRMELSQLFMNPEMNSLPILLLANKQDLPNALDLDYLKKYFVNSFSDSNYTRRQVILRSTCAVTGDGLFEALDQLYEMILNQNKKAKIKSSKKR